MSLFLGKIHFWLFNKVLWFQGLEEEIINLAKEEGLNTEALSKEINSKYGQKTENKNLEEIIDTSNIHGWLQAKIHSAEGRMAAWTKAILENNKESMTKLQDVYIKQGKTAADEVKKQREITNARDIYDSINDYILDGMPCDRVNEIIVSEEENVKWKRRLCVHKDIWEKENIDVAIFYKLRSL
ncbi:MAG: hypothetical protein MJ191_07545, partial [Clostridium sp.]|nr:hypothetical protein [Clostridium sp.]